MTSPTVSDIQNAGYKMTSNAPTKQLQRCATDVLSAYILKKVTAAEVASATSTDGIGRAWVALTFLRYMQDVEFATRTGGEKKNFDYGEHLEWSHAIKLSCAQRLLDLERVGSLSEKYDDICEVFFRTQIFN